MARGSKGSRVTVVLRADQVNKPETVTLKITVPAEVARVLKVEALGRNGTVGQVVAELVESTPRRFVLSERGRQTRRAEGSQGDLAPGPVLARGDPGPYGPGSSEVA